MERETDPCSRLSETLQIEAAETLEFVFSAALTLVLAPHNYDRDAKNCEHAANYLNCRLCIHECFRPFL